MDSQQPAGAKIAAGILVLLIVVPMIAILAGALCYITIYTWQSVLDLL